MKPKSIDDVMLLWGKAHPDERAVHPYHPLCWHSLDVMAVGEALLAQRLEALDAHANRLGWETEALRRWVLFALALHDIGKISRPFQAKRPDLWPEVVLGPMGTPQGLNIRHDRIGLGFVLGNEAEGLWDETLPGWKPADAEALLAPFMGHHGRPVDGGELPSGVMNGACYTAARAYFVRVHDLVRPKPLPRPPRMVLKQVGWWLAGLTVLADWVGSSQRWFPYVAPNAFTPEDYLERVARPKARAALQAAGLVPTAANARTGFSVIAGTAYPPSATQAWAETVTLPDGPLLALVEEVTGGGKTEAALVLAHRLMAAGRAKGIYVALPTMATANAMFKRLADGYGRLFAGDILPSLALAHGRSGQHKGFQESVGEIADPTRAGDGQVDEDEADLSGSFCAAWLSGEGRKAFLAEVGVGTVDQALLAVLPAKFQSLRLFGLADRVLVVDEAHAYSEAYMGKELERLLEFHAALGGSAVVLSATLPQARRRALAAAFTKRLGATAPCLKSDDYPLVTLVSKEAPVEAAKEARPDLHRRLAVERIADVDEALERIVAAERAGAAVAWVRNAVDDALEAVDMLKAQGVDATLFHARFALGDRLDIEDKVVKWLGNRDPKTPRRGVVVATQVLQESLDVDLDLMVADLAPVDLLLQRAGRLWRHTERVRPIDGPRLLVLSPEPVAAPTAEWYAGLLPRAASVYRNHAVVWRTARALFALDGAIVQERAVRVPEDVRGLIETVYADLENDPDIPAGLERGFIRAQGDERAGIGMANANLLSLAKGYGGDHIGWDADVRVPTRLGEPMTVLRLAKPNGDRLVPWCDDLNLERAWALSEASVHQRRLNTVTVPPGMKRAAAAARKPWTRYDEDKPLVPLLPAGDGTWIAEGLDGKGEKVVLRYDRARGLRFG